MNKGTIPAIAVMAAAYLLRIPVGRVAVSALGDRAAEGGPLDWAREGVDVVVIGCGLLAASLILKHFMPDPYRGLEAWARQRGLSRVEIAKGGESLPSDAPVTAALRAGSRRTVALMRSLDATTALEVRVVKVRGLRSLLALGNHEEDRPRVATQVAVVGLGELGTFSITPRSHFSKEQLRRHPPSIITEAISFNEEWILRGKDARAMHACLTPLVMARLLEADALGQVFEFRNGSVLSAIENVCDSRVQLDRRADALLALAGALPGHLRRP